MKSRNGFERIDNVKYRRFDKERQAVISTCGDYTRVGIAVPAKFISMGESSLTEPPVPSIVEMDRATAEKLADDLKMACDENPCYGQVGWHPIFLPWECIKVDGEYYHETALDKFLKAFKK